MNAPGHGLRRTALKATRLQDRTARVSFFLLRATVTSYRTTTLERVDTIGVLRQTRVAAIARIAFSSIVAVGAWIGSIAVAVGKYAQSQNRSEAHLIY